MPVRYDIAAGVPQQQGGGFDPINMMAQMQAMGYRQQQNALAQMQMEEYRRKMQAEHVLREMTPNFEDPRFAQQVFQYDPEFARQLYGSRLAGERERRMAEQAAAAAENIRAEQGLRQRKFEEIELPRAGIEKQKLGAEATKEERLGAEAKEKAASAALQRDADQLKNAENIGAKIFNADGAGYVEFYKSLPPALKPLLPETYDKERLASFVEQMATTQDKLKEAITAKRVTTTPFAAAPGYVLQTTPEGAARLVAPEQPGAAPIRAPMEGKFDTRVNALAPAAQNAMAASAAPEPSEVIGTPQNQRREAARSILNVAGYNPEKGGAYVADLIRNTPASAWREAVARSQGKISGEASKEVQNVGRLRTILDNMVLAATNFKLGGQISDADVNMLKEAASDMGNPNLQPEERLARWDEVMRIQSKMAGYKYLPVSTEKATKPIIGERKPAAVDEDAILKDVFGAKK